VRFNYKPQNLDRRHYQHTQYMHKYDFAHDYIHTTGYVDEDLDWEDPDPMEAMHYKKKRSQVLAPLGTIIAVALLFGFPMFGLKMP
jgi:hypothetical protein